MPSGLGNEAAGVVTKVGAGVSGFQVDYRVVYAQAGLGAYRAVHNVVADRVAHLPEAISFEHGAASFLKGLTVYYLLRETYEIKSGETFLFHPAAGALA